MPFCFPSLTPTEQDAKWLMVEWTSDIRWKHTRLHLMDKMQNNKKWPHHKERKKDTEIVCFNDVITCSLTTKRRKQRTRGKERKWRHKMDNCGFVETKKGQTSLLFYCTVHSIMWTLRNSKALGNTKQLLFLGYLNVFWRFGWMVFALSSSHSQSEMSYEVSDSLKGHVLTEIL